MDKKKCLICGKEFIPKCIQQNVCLDTHYFTCPICHKQYIPSKDQIRKYTKTGIVGGCSYSCRNHIGKGKRLERYGSYNNSNKIKETWKNMNSSTKQSYVDKVEQTKLERYGDSKYNNTQKKFTN